MSGHTSCAVGHRLSGRRYAALNARDLTVACRANGAAPSAPFTNASACCRDLVTSDLPPGGQLLAWFQAIHRASGIS